MTEPEQYCQAHQTPTRLTCARCGAPICPRCMHRTPVGLRCGDCAAPAHPPRRRSRRTAVVGLGTAAVAALAATAVVVTGGGSDGRAASSGPVAETVTTGVTADRLQGVVDEIAEGGPGGTVAWVDTGQRQVGAAAGVVDRRSGQRLTGDEAFAISTVSKLITATVTLQLVEEGALALDQPIAEVIPEQAARFEHGDRITVRHLLSYTSGLAHPAAEPFGDELLAQVSVDEGVVTATCRSSRPDPGPLETAADRAPRFEPGADGAYSPTDDVLLRHVVETAAGKPVAQAYRERVFEPLGMDHTWLRCAQSPRAEVARGYAATRHVDILSDVDAEIVDVTDLDKPWAAHRATLMSTGQDLATFLRALVDGRLFDDDATWQAMRDARPVKDAPVPYGLGLEVSQGIVGHWGARPGYQALVRYYPTLDAVVVALSSQPHQRGRPAARRAVSDAVAALDAGTDS